MGKFFLKPTVVTLMFITVLLVDNFNFSYDTFLRWRNYIQEHTIFKRVVRIFFYKFPSFLVKFCHSFIVSLHSFFIVQWINFFLFYYLYTHSLLMCSF